MQNCIASHKVISKQSGFQISSLMAIAQASWMSLQQKI